MKNNVISILFVCHGNILTRTLNPSKIKAFL
jgi:hypothetical protein